MVCFHAFFPLAPFQKQPETEGRLRWKLLIAASLLAAVAGACSYFAVTYLLLAFGASPSAWEETLLLLSPLGAIIFASIFVYRHTPRRRALQAATTALLASLFTFAALLAIFVAIERAR